MSERVNEILCAANPQGSASAIERLLATAETVGGRIRCENARPLLARILAASGVAGRGGDGENGRYERGLRDRALVDSHQLRSTRR
jgi:hypothetical protein